MLPIWANKMPSAGSEHETFRQDIPIISRTPPSIQEMPQGNARSNLNPSPSAGTNWRGPVQQHAEVGGQGTALFQA